MKNGAGQMDAGVKSMMEPPLGYCRERFSPVTGRLGYYFDGVPLISTPLTEDRKPYFRRISDGNLQSRPMIQQIYLALDRGRDTEITFFLGPDSVNMKPSRARNEEAILGQVGRPLLYGVNGLYDIGRDILVTWEGANWRWLDDELLDAFYDPGNDMVVIVEPGEKLPEPGLISGKAARVCVELSVIPWTVQVLMRYYADHLGYTYHAPWKRRPNLSPVTGWCSWEAYNREIDAGKLAETVRFLEENLAPYGLEYVQVDDGYQSEPYPPTAGGDLRDSWLVPNERFPGGHEDIRGVITKAGFKAGIWTSAGVSNRDFAVSDGNCLIGPDGEPFEQPWIGFIASCSDDFVENQIVPLFRGLEKEGYRYFKADTLRHLIFEGLMGAVESGIITNDDAESRFRTYLKAIREGIGDDAFLLTCWGVLTQVVGLCDACRIAGDANPTWGSFRMQILETARWFHTQRILFQADPDHICARSHLDWTRSLLSMVSLTGGLFMLSDDVGEYDGERLAMIRKTIPAQPVMTAETGPVILDKPAYAYTPGSRKRGSDLTVKEALQISAARIDDLQHHAFGNLWAVHYLVDGRRWCVAGRFALIPIEECDLQLSALGLDPQKRYHAFDFWAERYLGCVRGELPCRSLGLGECQIIGLTAEKDRPAYVADNRHISMGLHFLTREAWDGNTLELGVRGVRGVEFSCWIASPDGFEPGSLRGNGVSVRWADDDPKAAARRLVISFLEDEGTVVVSF